MPWKTFSTQNTDCNKGLQAIWNIKSIVDLQLEQCRPTVTEGKKVEEHIIMVKGANGTKMLIAHINLVVAMYVLHNHQHGIKTHSLRVFLFLFLSFFSSAVHLLLLAKRGYTTAVQEEQQQHERATIPSCNFV